VEPITRDVELIDGVSLKHCFIFFIP